MRASGVLLPISSLPSKYGIGCFSKEAYEFVDQLIAGGQKFWQILPLGPTGYGDSPYQSFSTYAGNPYFIDLEALIARDLLTEEECSSCDWGGSESYVDYEKVYESRFKLLRLAFDRYDLNPDQEYWEFVRENGFWLEDYALYMAIKDSLDNIAWNEWPQELKDRHPHALQKAREDLAQEITFYRFQQYLFQQHWRALKNYANENGIQIIGDIPIYVAFDSADTWANPLMFQFDENNSPIAVAGCPPDGFTPEGQLWGNPLYSWEYHRSTEYAWWIQRIEYSFRLYDMVRIDHFRGFDEYYSVPFGDKTAQFGHWEKGPGLELFRTVKDRLGDLNVIAEDLGFLTDGVRQLLRDSGFPGMKVLQFAFDDSHNSDYLIHKYSYNTVVYTGTHDNDTTRNWLETAGEDEREFALAYANSSHEDVKQAVWDIIRLAISSVADLAVVPVQDYLCLGGEARMNTPSTLGDNWKWRLTRGQLDYKVLEKMKDLAHLYGRI